MKRIGILVIVLATFIAVANAQNAKSILDRTAEILSNKGGITAKFSISGQQAGTLAFKGRAFHASTPQAVIWFDGTTQWTYMKNNEEVNISKPDRNKQQMMNPYNFIMIYKAGYRYTAKAIGNSYQVHLTSTDARRNIKEMYITVGKKTYIPSQIRILQNKTWTTIDISNFKKANLNASTFKFNSKEYPNAEIIDLR
ncbi:LolA-like putative outer membrane lipoprotein chaperone [Xylanibacter muris]|uniref:Cell envelope biogenesis protein LolA n=1 Tax=Xylanibacter muris TaxID=2736290 RepID=A0ABX2AR97_9BACT|nr:LolA-like putative outer membrane lipoprotein chaperone [Xylanibacter muris]NPD92755.1 cell envelope biogenesis protein LolA [Xylanibacter muris]